MPQTTLDRATDQARTMMQKGQQQMKRVRQTLRANAQSSAALGQRLRGMRASSMRGNWRMPARVAWHAGKLVGQVQGARTLAPHAARGWWAGVAGRGGSRAQQVGRIARLAGIAFVGTRIVSRALPTLRDLRQATRKSQSARVAQKNGALSYVTAPMPALVVPATTAVRQATRQAWQRMRRGQPVMVVQPSNAWTSQGWVLPVALIVGFALGALAGYLFTPAGPGFTQVTSRTKGQPDARFSDS